MEKKEIYLKVVKELLLVLAGNPSDDVLTQVHFNTLTLIENLYGQNDVRISTLVKFKTEKYDPTPWYDATIRHFKNQLIGILRGIQSDIENDLIFNLEKQTIGSIEANFIALSKSISEQGGKDVAAVLASAALEDSLKRFAELSGLDVNDKEMSDVINALKSKGLLKGPQASVAASYVQTRNKAFHAEFSKIEMPEVKSLIAFTEEFILKNLS